MHAAGCEALLPHGLGPSAFELSAASAIRHMTYFLLRVRPPSKHRPAELNGFGLMPSDWLEVIIMHPSGKCLSRAISGACQSTSFDMHLKEWSEREDSNLRPLAPEASALPGCATLRPTKQPQFRLIPPGRTGLGAPGNRRYSDPHALPQAPGGLFAERQNSRRIRIAKRGPRDADATLHSTLCAHCRAPLPGCH